MVQWSYWGPRIKVLVGSKGEGLGDQTTPGRVGLLDGEGWGPEDISVEEWGADSVEGSSLNGSKGGKAGL